jgi:uncharacterized protein
MTDVSQLRGRSRRDDPPLRHGDHRRNPARASFDAGDQAISGRRPATGSVSGYGFAPTGTDYNFVQRALTGGYPEVIARPDGRKRLDWLAAYINLLATLGGQLINASAMGTWLKIDRKTALRYLGLAEQLFIVRSLPAWSSNALKRLTKAPKLHFIE